MPAVIKFTKEDIVNATISIIRENGFESISARDVAKGLGCSTQPIFRVFDNMNDLKNSARVKAWEIYKDFLESVEQIQSKKGMSFGIGYIKFAIEEKNLFKLIFMAQSIDAKTLDTLVVLEENVGLIDIFMDITGLCRERASKLHLNLWLAMHGLAAICATNPCVISDEEIIDFISQNFKAQWDYQNNYGGGKL